MDDRDAIERVVRDYFEGWFTADVDRMDSALHPELVKRWPGEDGTTALPVVSKERMLELTAERAGVDDVGDGTLDITVADVHGEIATAVVHGGVYREYLHLVRTEGEWRIANALWVYE